MGNHSNSTFFLISTSEWGRSAEVMPPLFCLAWASVLLIGHVASPKGFNERASPGSSNGQKLHWMRMLGISFFALREVTGRKAIVTFIPGSGDTIE